MEASIDICGDNRAGEVRRAITELARLHGMSEAHTGRALLVGTELSTNLLKYGQHGHVTVSWFEDADGERRSAGIQLLAVDHGPGIADFEHAARDGHSTGGSLGLGLGVLRRNADTFDVHSLAGKGSAFLARIGQPPVDRGAAHRVLVTGSREMPKPGQAISGDAWTSIHRDRWHRYCIADGLGHGPLAATASGAAVRLVEQSQTLDTPGELLNRAHQALKGTRGAVMAVVDVDLANNVLDFAGVGNTLGIIATDGQTQHLMPLEGIVGYNMRGVRQHRYPFLPSSVLILATDGLSSRLPLDRDLMNKHPALIAGVLFRDHARNTDDATLLVARCWP